MFDVSIPDGYDTFHIDYLNGSIINQNYLNVGDTLVFKFNNQPLRYTLPSARVTINTKDNDNTTFTDTDDATVYHFIDVDVNRYYKVCYLPIYQLYDDSYGGTIYIFNPCDRSQLLDSPTDNIPAYTIYDNGVTSILAEFTGNYVIGLQPIDKIPDLTVTIGESISNNRLRPQDLGSYQISSGIVNEVSTTSVTSNSYTYGSSWEFPVESLLINHQETIVTKPPTSAYALSVVLMFAEKDTNNRYYTTNLYITTGYLGTDGNYSNDDEITFKEYDQLTHTINDPQHTYIITESNSSSPRKLYVCKTDPSDQSHYISLSEEANYSVKGSDITNTVKLYEIDSITGVLTQIDTNSNTYKYINTDWYYRFVNCLIKVSIISGGPIGNTFHIDYTTATKIICDGVTQYVVYDSTTQVSATVTFTVYDPNANDFISLPVELFYTWIIGDITADDNGIIRLSHKLITGVLESSDYIINTDYLTQQSLQLTTTTYDISDDNSGLLQMCDEDLYIEHITDGGVDGLRLCTVPLNNTIHQIEITTTEEEETEYEVNNIPMKWYKDDYSTPSGDDLDLLCFIPHKTSNVPERYYRGLYTHGMFVIRDLEGDYNTSMSNSTSEYYLAVGHKSLNVEPPADDDLKFKTFNGSLLFDRSNSRITRLFSNDVTGSCLGYINDILAARLSRYYTVMSHNCWNTFLDIDTNSTVNLSRNIQELNNIYSTYDMYTGDHSSILSSCIDLVKLIGSEQTTSNCMPSCVPERQSHVCSICSQNDIQNFSDTTTNQFNYKLFHCYSSDIYDLPSVGTSVQDNSEIGIVNGYHIKSIDKQGLTDSTNSLSSHKITDGIVAVVDIDQFTNHKDEVITGVVSYPYYYSNGSVSDYGYIETLPVYRLYRNSNFDQTDLTITTGGIKTKHPVYLQCTPRLLISNLLYMFDFVINRMLDQYGSITDDKYKLGWLCAITMCQTGDITSLTDTPNVKYPIRRFSKGFTYIDGVVRYVSTSLDSFFILDYIRTTHINDYRSNAELIDTLPTTRNDSNEELISDISTSSQDMNVQLLSVKRFDFGSCVDITSMVTYIQHYVEQVYYNNNLLKLYYNVDSLWNDTGLNTEAVNCITSLINNQSDYNNLKSCKLLIVKLGEFLQYPHILYLVSNTYNNSLNVSVENYNSSDLRSPIASELTSHYDSNSGYQVTVEKTELRDITDQKINTYLFGVMFKYHQLALGYQNLNNELNTEYMVSRALGNRHFKLLLVDEYGRRIPTTDTSQGFDNNLYLELTLESTGPTKPSNQAA